MGLVPENRVDEVRVTPGTDPVLGKQRCLSFLFISPWDHLTAASGPSVAECLCPSASSLQQGLQLRASNERLLEPPTPAPPEQEDHVPFLGKIAQSPPLVNSIPVRKRQGVNNTYGPHSVPGTVQGASFLYSPNNSAWFTDHKAAGAQRA